MKTSDHLLRASQDIWEHYNTHPFVKGIEAGTLDENKFRYYIIQDYLYLEDYAKAFAVGIAKAKNREVTRLFSSYIALLTGSEMDIHRGYMGKFAVTQAELDATPQALANLSYTSYMLRVAYEEGEVEILTAIMACAISYEFIARKIVANNPAIVDHPFYGDWVKGYTSESYAKANEVITDLLDNLTEVYSPQQINHLVEIFVACSRYEFDFWEMSWNKSK